MILVNPGGPGHSGVEQVLDYGSVVQVSDTPPYPSLERKSEFGRFSNHSFAGCHWVKL